MLLDTLRKVEKRGTLRIAHDLRAPPRPPPCGDRPPAGEEKQVERSGVCFSCAPQGRPQPAVPRGDQGKWQSHISLREYAGQVFRYGIATGRCERHPGDGVGRD